MGIIKTVKSHPVEGPYNQTKYTAKVKQGKNNTFTWTEDAEEYDYNKGVHVGIFIIFQKVHQQLVRL